MPKTNEGRTVDSEANLARRIEMLRTERGWSYERLAKEMTDVGCKIQATALHKVEKGDKKTGKLRRITVNELTALAKVFETTTDDLLTDIELIEQERAHELIEEIRRCMADFADLASANFNALWQLYELAYENAELAEYVAHQLDSGTSGRYKIDTRDIDSPEGEVVADLALLRAVKANYDHTTEMRKAAMMWAAYRNGNWTTKDQRRAETELTRLRGELEKLKVEREEDED
ncbi:MAG TPA: helix-turn-helix transcriptional regulator [Nocardioides sp.]|uniref:helix-turn-helix domain-containing protein n=1 Tax=Nocardioides sp. TaxID=35761 RepID=UPI002ED9F115